MKHIQGIHQVKIKIKEEKFTYQGWQEDLTPIYQNQVLCMDSCACPSHLRDEQK